MKDDTPRLLSAESCERVLRTLTRLYQQKDIGAVGRVPSPTLFSWWNSELRWARNSVVLATGRRDIRLAGNASTNQTDEVSMENLVESDRNRAELIRAFRFSQLGLEAPRFAEPNTLVWSDRTFDADLSTRTRFIQSICDAAQSEGMLTAGYMEMRGGRLATLDEQTGALKLRDFTQAQCSMTVRHPKGIASGWAGLSSYDWASIDADALAKEALAKCVASLNPVAIEPGRYTVVLEPDAVLGLTDMLEFNREPAEGNTGQSPWFLEIDMQLDLVRSKLGLKVVDERITIEHDPVDPILGVLTESGLAPVKWITNGVLTSLSTPRQYGLEAINDNLPILNRFAYRISGGTTSKEEMIASTERGLLVTRFSQVVLLDKRSVLCTGLTRDGLWLIEKGKITKAVKNMRFTESPVFMLNQVAELGIPSRTFRPHLDLNAPGVGGAVVPLMKARDFSFTSMVDAI